MKLLCSKGFKVFGLDNNLRQRFVGPGGSTDSHRQELDRDLASFLPLPVDIRDEEAVENVFRYYGPFDIIVHSAGQPAHGWATDHPLEDFKINALGTVLMLEQYRRCSADAVFIHVSSSRVYGGHIADLPVEELDTRYDLPDDHPFFPGIDESISLDQTTRSLFGVSKVSGDLAAQEYGRYFGLKVVVLRPVTVTGPAHQASASHGYLGHLVRSLVTGQPYVINGFKGKQVRDNIHVHDLVEAFWEIYLKPEHTFGNVFNIGAGRRSNNSILEVIDQVQSLTGRTPNVRYVDQQRKADWRWCIFNPARFQRLYPLWTIKYDNDALLADLCRYWLDQERTPAPDRRPVGPLTTSVSFSNSSRKDVTAEASAMPPAVMAGKRAN